MEMSKKDFERLCQKGRKKIIKESGLCLKSSELLKEEKKKRPVSWFQENTKPMQIGLKR